MQFTYQKSEEAKQGNSIVTTIDSYIQYVAEKYLDEAVETEHAVGEDNWKFGLGVAAGAEQAGIGVGGQQQAASDTQGEQGFLVIHGSALVRVNRQSSGLAVHTGPGGVWWQPG